MKKLLLFFALVIPFLLSAQRTDNRLSQDLRWRNIGPANMMGRIAAIDALNNDYRQVLCASASGGVFKSSNGGLTWEPIFDRYGAGSIGSVAFFQADPNLIWVGTGEAANRNSSGYGDGIYKSTDGGKTFTHMGLAETHHIAEIAPHPTDPDIVYVAAVGHLWGYSGERGLFKTTDGGKTWTKLTDGLPADPKSGCTEVIIHPTKPNIVFAGFYERLRRPYWYTSGGPNGGIYKSTDGGKTWKKITKGLAEGDSGMIDLSICRKYPNIMVAAYEADEHLPEGVPGSGVYRSDDGGESWQFLLKHAVRPFYHGQIEIDPIDPDNIYVVSRDFRISRDGGKNFRQRRWRTDGGDDHDMWIAPYDNKIMYLATDQGLRLSVDGGETFLSFNNMAIGQYYAIGVDMRDPYWVIGGLQDNGLWTGPSNSRERRGILNEHNTWVGEGDGFHAQVDPTDWRTLYIVNHVGFAARLNLETREHEYITPTPETIVNFTEYFDPDFPEPMIRYTIDPGEHWFFYERLERPKLPAQFRFNWSSPLVLSPNNPHTVYFGGNHVFKSVDQGKTWRIISPDLTTNNPEWRNPTQSGYLTNSVTGGENYCTIITIAESPLDPAVVWAGTDDGNVQLTRDGGATWTNVTPNFPGLPSNSWVSRVEPSHFEAGHCYVSFDRHRSDDMSPYLYVTEDYGQTWRRINDGIPDNESIYVVREDPENPYLLFAGTEMAVHVSLDRGSTWQELMAGLPTVAIHDLVIHPRDGDLIAGTHGRSIWILDDLTPLRAMAGKQTGNNELQWLPSRQATRWQQIFTGRKQPYFEFRGENPAYGATIHFLLDEATPGDSATISIRHPLTGRQAIWKVPVKTGLNRQYWDLTYPATTEELKDYQEAIAETIRQLSGRVQKPALLDTLMVLQQELPQAMQRRELNQIRGRLAEHFSGYAGGRPFFPEKKNRHEADPGRHEVTITCNGLQVEGWVEVREDPLLEE